MSALNHGRPLVVLRSYQLKSRSFVPLQGGSSICLRPDDRELPLPIKGLRRQVNYRNTRRRATTTENRQILITFKLTYYLIHETKRTEPDGNTISISNFKVGGGSKSLHAKNAAMKAQGPKLVHSSRYAYRPSALYQAHRIHPRELAHVMNIT